MRESKVSVDWLQQQEYFEQNIYQPPTIEGVLLKDLKALVDGRGDVIELWSLPWVEQEGFVVPQHCYQSATDFGVTKCWHLHAVHTDQFTVTRGKVLHGWKALSQPEVIVVNFQSHVYDSTDELKFPWDCILKPVWQPLNG
ncbi:hypothetical protein HYS10_00295 [Candidatus Collierbacteria bacterium]|nr:hypothetical protein [Candidatus Collierbacteria bacterium]